MCPSLVVLPIGVEEKGDERRGFPGQRKELQIVGKKQRVGFAAQKTGLVAAVDNVRTLVLVLVVVEKKSKKANSAACSASFVVDVQGTEWCLYTVHSRNLLQPV